MPSTNRTAAIETARKLLSDPMPMHFLEDIESGIRDIRTDAVIESESLAYLIVQAETLLSFLQSTKRNLAEAEAAEANEAAYLSEKAA